LLFFCNSKSLYNNRREQNMRQKMMIKYISKIVKPGAVRRKRWVRIYNNLLPPLSAILTWKYMLWHWLHVKGIHCISSFYLLLNICCISLVFAFKNKLHVTLGCGSFDKISELLYALFYLLFQLNCYKLFVCCFMVYFHDKNVHDNKSHDVCQSLILFLIKVTLNMNSETVAFNFSWVHAYIVV